MTEQLDAGFIAEQVTEHPESMDAPDPTQHIGRPLRRKEDRRLITGRTRWTDNIQIPGLLHMAIVRSPIAHARINRIDVSPALERPGVIAAFSAADLGDALGVLPCAWPVTPDMVHPDHHPLATDEVRHVGEAVAVIIARDRYSAADALEAVEVDYEPLPAVTDMEEALKDETLVHSDKGTNKSFLWPFDSGDYDAARARAEAEGGVVVKRRYIQQRLIPAAMEPRAVVVEPLTEGDEYTVYSATQIPHILRLMLALTCNIPEQQLRVVAPDVGGG
ncbi:MAG TPA: molybdopterin cofactor-binding domain-containing protein, partial [Mycobacteriales bacterium]